jgi:hypothetical protein
VRFPPRSSRVRTSSAVLVLALVGLMPACSGGSTPTTTPTTPTTSTVTPTPPTTPTLVTMFLVQVFGSTPPPPPLAGTTPVPPPITWDGHPVYYCGVSTPVISTITETITVTVPAGQQAPQIQTFLVPVSASTGCGVNVDPCLGAIEPEIFTSSFTKKWDNVPAGAWCLAFRTRNQTNPTLVGGGTYSYYK